MKPTIVFNSNKLTPEQQESFDKGESVSVEIISPRNEIFTLFGKGLDSLPKKQPVKLQVCTAPEPDFKLSDSDFEDVIMFGQPVVLDTDNTIVNLEMTGHYQLVIPKLPPKKILILGFY